MVAERTSLHAIHAIVSVPIQLKVAGVAIRNGSHFAARYYDRVRNWRIRPRVRHRDFLRAVAVIEVVCRMTLEKNARRTFDVGRYRGRGGDGVAAIAIRGRRRRRTGDGQADWLGHLAGYAAAHVRVIGRAPRNGEIQVRLSKIGVRTVCEWLIRQEIPRLVVVGRVRDRELNHRLLSGP